MTGCFSTCLTRVNGELVPRLTLRRMVGEGFGVFGPAAGINPLDRPHDRSVERPPTFLRQGFVHHLLDQRVLEGV